MATHRATRQRIRRTPRAILTATAAMAGAVVLAIAGAGGTYAMWNSSATLNPGTITAGSTGLTVNTVTNHTIASNEMIGTLLPGRSRITLAPVAVRNPGTTAVSVTAGAPTITGALAAQVNVAIRQVATSTSACTPTAVGGTPTTLTAPVTLAAGATVYMCVEVQLKSTAPAASQGQSAQFTLPLNAAQVQP